MSAQSGGEGEAAAAPAPTAGTPPGGASRLLGRLADTPQNTRADVRVLSQRPGESLVEVEHPELGRVRLRVATGAGGVDVRAVAESLGAAWALRRSEDELRPRIARLGAELRRFDVRTGALAQLRPGKEPGPALPRTTPLARPGARLHRKA
ncbi:MAG: flagellar hook-length control protein FliK [Myxococcota bacterium]